MRGVGLNNQSSLVRIQIIYYILMRTFNQPYSEIKKIPLNNILFLINYEEAIQDYIKQQIDKQRNK